MKTRSNQTTVFKTNNWLALLAPILLCAAACFFSVLTAQAQPAIANGTFNSGIGSWTTAGGSWTGDAMILNGTGDAPPANDPKAEQTISGFTVGNKYLITGDFKGVYTDFGSASAYSFGVEISGMSVKEYQRPQPNGTTATFTYSFTATSSSHLLRITAERNGDDSSYQIDNISIVGLDGTLDLTFNPGSGANNNVYATVLQSDGKILIGGAFTTVDGTTRQYIARLNTDGSLDTGFTPSTLNGNVYSIAIQPADGKIVLGGNFTTVGASSHARVTRLSTSGAVDTTFNPGSGANQSVNAVALQSDGKILVGGSFTTFNGVTHNYLVRLNSGGSVDTGYAPSISSYVYSLAIQSSDGNHIIGGDVDLVTGTYHRDGCARIYTMNGTLDTGFAGVTLDGPVLAIVLQPYYGKANIVGGFSSINSDASYSGIGRLNTDGTLDTSFDPGTAGPNGPVFALNLRPDGRILIGGGFSAYNGQTRNNVARLNSNGTLDTTFDAGAGPNNTVWSTALQTDGSLVIGGGFTEVSGVGRNRIARLY